jgi:hypothetical protein
MAKFEAKKLSPVDWGVVGAGGVALIALFLPWYGASAGIYSASVSGWSTSYGWLGALLIVLAGVYVALKRSDVKVPTLPVGAGVLVLGVGGLGTLIVALRWVTLPSGAYGIGNASFSYGPRAGIIIALLAGVVQVVCAFMLFRASGEAMPWAKQGTSAGAPGMPPPAQGIPTPTPTESMIPTAEPNPPAEAPATDDPLPPPV